MNQKTMLVNLSEPGLNSPFHALQPMPGEAKSVGMDIYNLIRETDPGYNKWRFMQDFRRINLYPTGHAMNGKGSVKRDKQNAAFIMLLADYAGVQHIVLIGKRVQYAFRTYCDMDDAGLVGAGHCGGRLVTFYAIPSPTKRGHWLSDPHTRESTSKLLALLKEI